MFEYSKFTSISLAIAVGAFSLLFILGIDRIQQTALPVFGGAVLLWIVIVGTRYWLAEKLPSWSKQSREMQKTQQQKTESKKRAKMDVDNAKWEIGNAFEKLTKGDVISQEDAINVLVGYGSAMAKPMLDLFSQALEAHANYYQGGNPYHYHSPGAYGGPGMASWTIENIKHREWEANGDRIKGMILNLADGLSRLGDPESVHLLKYGQSYFEGLKNRNVDSDQWILVQYGEAIRLNERILKNIKKLQEKI